MKTIILFFSILAAVGLTALQAQDTWTQKADFGGTARKQAVAFSIGTKGYVGTGFKEVAKKDFWEYDPALNAWTQKSDFGGAARWTAAAFEISGKGYIGTGYDGSGSVKDFWEYDPVANIWTKKADFGGTARYGAVGLSIEDKGYMGTGVDGAWRKDFWEYDPESDTWTQIANYGGVGREVAVGFSINSKGYVGTGYTIGVGYKDFWEYDPVTNAWTKKADFGGGNRIAACGFSLNGKGYIGTGEVPYQEYQNDWWEYDPITNSWSQKTNLTATGRYMAVAFSVDGKGYLGTGITHEGDYLKDFWEYTPEGCSGLTVYADADADNYGDASNSLFVEDCVIPSGYVIDNKDCNDASASINPGKTEILNGIDDNCNGEIDEGFGQDTWTQVADFAGSPRTVAVGFSIGDKGYLGTGQDNNSKSRNDFWEYSPNANVWTQKADVGGEPRSYAIGVSMTGRGYIGTGLKNDGSYAEDFWEYDPAANTWIEKAKFPGGPRSGAMAFAIGTKAYVGTGEAGGIGGQSTKDLWEYDQVANSWTPKADFAGSKIKNATGISISDKGYLVCGWAGAYKKETWEYDPFDDTWSKRADFGGNGRTMGVGFAIGNAGYIGTGESGGINQKDFWQYEPATDTWTKKADYGGGEIGWSAGFAIDNEGYLGTGYSWGIGYRNIFWKYTPAAEPSCTVPSRLTSANITATSAELNWDATANAKGYKIVYEMTDGSGPLKTTFEKTGSKVISNLKPNTQYSWRVKSVCSLDPKLTSNWSAKQFFTTGTLKMGDEATTALAVYPNPVVETFTLHLQLQSSSVQSATIYLLNTLGQIVYNEKTTVENGLLLKEIKLNEHPTGMYLVKVIVNDQVYSASINYQK